MLPKRRPDRSLNARYTTTTSATPVATAMAACITVAGRGASAVGDCG